MTKQEITKMLIKVTKVINSCETMQQAEIAEKYAKLALDRVSKHYREIFQMTKILKNLTEELTVVADIYGRLSDMYTKIHLKTLREMRKSRWS